LIESILRLQSGVLDRARSPAQGAALDGGVDSIHTDGVDRRVVVRRRESNLESSDVRIYINNFPYRLPEITVGQIRHYRRNAESKFDNNYVI
jgi:hypothetical protein